MATQIQAFLEGKGTVANQAVKSYTAVVHACNPSAWEAEARGSRGQSGTHGETPSQKKKRKRKATPCCLYNQSY